MNSRKKFVLAMALSGALAALASVLPRAAMAQREADPVFVPPPPSVTRLYLVVPLKFDDSIGQPLKPNAEYLNLFTDPRLGAEIYYRVASNYRFSIGGHVRPAPPAEPGAPAPAPLPPAPGPEGAEAATEGTSIAEAIVLQRASQFYMGTGDGAGGAWNHQTLVDELVPLLEQTFDLTKFYGIALFPNVTDGPGLATSARPMAKRRGATTREALPTICLNPKNATMSALVREVGHQLGFGNPTVAGGATAAPAWAAPAKTTPGKTTPAEATPTTEAAPPADAPSRPDASGMTFVGDADGRVGTITCDHIMWHKIQAGWTAPADVKVVEAPTSYIFQIFPRSAVMTGVRMVKVPLQAEGEFLMLEAVLPSGIDGVSGLKEFGVLAHRVHEMGKVSTTAASAPPEQPEAILSPRGGFFQRGESWTSPGGEVTFKVERITQEFCNVRVTAK